MADDGLDLDAIAARANAATPGPWWAFHNLATRQWAVAPTDAHTIAAEGDAARVDMKQALRDAEFIAHARADIPALLAEIDRLRSALAEIAEYGGGDGGDWIGCCNIARDALDRARDVMGGLR